MDPRSPTGERTPIGGRMRSASPLARSLSAPPLQGEEGERSSRPPIMMVLHEEEEAEALMGHGHEHELEHEIDDEAKVELKSQQDQMQRLAASILLDMHNGTDSGTGSASSTSAIGAAVPPSTTNAATTIATTTSSKPLVVDLTPRKTASGTVRRALNPICANSSTPSTNTNANTNTSKVNSPMLALRRNSSLRGSLHQQQQPYYDLTIA